MAARRTTKKKNTAKLPFGAKSNFVRKHPKMPAKELSALAKKEGLQITEAHIYNIRATDRKAAGKPAAGKRKSAKATRAVGGSPEEQAKALIRQAAMHVGLHAIPALVDEVLAEIQG